jgi:predicted glycoside hydrolase/deacetylase ChbG (UPF0249 family)
MVNMPGTEEAVDLAERHPGLGMGLHFNLTEGRPLTNARSLIDSDGAFLLRGELIRRSIRGRVQPSEITRELTAQLDRFVSLGLTPTHLDSHQHVHMVPTVFRAMAPVLRERVRALRVVVPAGHHTSRPQPATMTVNAMLRLSAASIRRRFPGRTNDRFVSLHQLHASQPWNEDAYRSLIGSVPSQGVTELMVHPFAEADDLVLRYADDPIRDVRMAFIAMCRTEHHILTENGVFDGSDIELVTYAEAG